MHQSIIQDAIELRDPTLAREALREIDLLLSSTPDPNERAFLLFSKSSCYGVLGKFEEAREQLFLALQNEPEDPETRMTVEFSEALLSQQEGSYREALKRFTAVLSSHAERLSRPELRFMYEDIQQRRAFLSVTLSQFQDSIPFIAGKHASEYQIPTSDLYEWLSSVSRRLGRKAEAERYAQLARPV
jgi:tetratricopeptide (TPR) repeat protein